MRRGHHGSLGSSPRASTKSQNVTPGCFGASGSSSVSGRAFGLKSGGRCRRIAGRFDRRCRRRSASWLARPEVENFASAADAFFPARQQTRHAQGHDWIDAIGTFDLA